MSPTKSRSKASILSLEVLENRLTPTVNVTASGTTISLTGDAANNQVAVFQDGGGNLFIYGDSNTPISGSGTVSAAVPDTNAGGGREFNSGLFKDLVISLGSGNDTVQFSGLRSSDVGSVTVNTGNSTAGDVVSFAPSGFVGNPDTTWGPNAVSGAVDITTGNGADQVNLNSISASTISVTNNGGNDTLAVDAAGTSFANGMQFHGNAGDTVNLTGNWTHGVDNGNPGIYSSTAGTLKVFGGATVNGAPSTTVSFPANSGAYSNAGWTGAVTGTASDGTGSGVTLVQISVFDVATNKYWGGTSFNSSSPVLFTTTGTTNWSYTFPLANFPADGQYVVTSSATDSLQNVQSPGTTATFVIDKTPPTTALSTPSPAGQFFSQQNNPGGIGITGTAADAGSGVAGVSLFITNSTGKYWNGSTFVATSTSVATSLTAGNWSYTFTGIGSPDGLYTVQSVANDKAGNVQATTITTTFNIDNAAPTASLTTPPPAFINASSANSFQVVMTYSDTGSGVDANTIVGGNLTVNNGATVTFVSATGGVATYTISAPGGNWSTAPQGIYTLALVGGTTVGGVKDLAGNEIAANASINTFTVDTIAPTITGVSSNTTNGTYGPGAAISIQVSFSKIVTVTGVPSLALNSGGTATYVGGSGTKILTFTYTVAAGQNSADLDYTSATALALSGGTIRDAATNNATLTLVAPGAVGSLGNAKALVVLTSRRFDMTSSTASVPDSSWTSVRGNKLYTTATGYGWTAAHTESDSATSFPAGSNASDQNLYRDFHYGGGTATFQVYVGVGKSASVKVYSYPQSAYSLGMAVTVAGPGGTTATVGSVPYVTVTGNADSKGILTVTMRGGIFGLWLVNAMEVTVL